MNNKVAFILGLIFGALAGVGASYCALEEKYEKKLNTEVESVKETFKDKLNEELHKVAEDNREGKERIAEKYPEVAKTTYRSVTDSLGYSSDDSFRMPSDVPIQDIADIPVQDSLIDQKKPGDTYEIPKEEFGGDGEYRTVDLNYYSDGTLTDDQDYPVEDIPESIGNDMFDALDERLQSGHDEIYIRNAERGVDYRVSLTDESSEE